MIYILFLFVGSTVTDLEAESACVGDDVTLAWIYGLENDATVVSWKVNSTSLTNEILLKVPSGQISIKNDYNVVHNSNGNITLTNVSVNNTGTYSIEVNWNTAAQVIKYVTVNVNGKN